MTRTKAADAPRDVKQLVVWRKSVDLCKAVYVATQGFPPAERFGLTAQMRRAGLAIPSNLAEGRGRGSRPEYRQFVVIARGSACELETQLIIAQELGFLKASEAEVLLDETREVIRMLHGLVRSLSPE
jgi:four helix bundle protein